MNDVVDGIKTYLPALEQGTHVDESCFILDSQQLRQIVLDAVEKATETLLERMTTLEDEAEMRAYAHSIKMTAIDSRLQELENKPRHQLQQDRVLILKSLIAANGGKMLEKDARQRMHLSKQVFSNLLAMIKGDIQVKPLESNKSCNILVLMEGN